MADELIEQITADREAGTPDLGGWAWFGGRDNLYLATNHGGRQFVMDFSRKGMRSAQPRFQIGGIMYGALDALTEYEVGNGTARGQKEADADPSVYRMDVKAIDHPDARRLARVPDMESRILADAKVIEAADALAEGIAALDKRGHTDAVWHALKHALNAYHRAKQGPASREALSQADAMCGGAIPPEAVGEA